MSKKRLFLLFTVLAVALLAVVPAIAGISGSGVSGVQIQNLSTASPVNVVVELWNQDGSAPLTVSASGGDTINAGAAKNYYLPSLPGVPDGAYAMAVSAGGPIAAIARTEWNAVGGAALYSSVAPGSDVVIPLVTGNFANQTSQFSIQNTNTTAAINDVDITLYGRGLAAPVATLDNQSIAAGTSKTYSLADAVWGTLPDTGLDMGATGFVGSIRITSATDLVVQSFIDLPGTRGVTGFTGVPTASASTTLYCPLIRANYFGDTGISIVNSNASAVDVEITFYADAGSPNSGTFTQDINVPANSSAVAFQGPGGNSRAAPTNLPGGTQGTSNPTLTNDGFYGVAKMEATGGAIQAVVNDAKFGAGWAVQAQSTYNCVTAAEAGTSFALPLVRRYHLATTRLTTGINIQNVTASDVTVSLELYNWDGTRQAASDPADVVIPAFGSGNYFNGNLTGLPTVPPEFGGSGWFGSAILTATGNVVPIVADEGFGSTLVDTANYNALLMP